MINWFETPRGNTMTRSRPSMMTLAEERAWGREVASQGLRRLPSSSIFQTLEDERDADRDMAIRGEHRRRPWEV